MLGSLMSFPHLVVGSKTSIHATISHERVSFEGPCAAPGGYCEDTDSHTGVEPNFAGGGRFLFGETVGLFVRLGIPYLSVGASILL